MLEVTYQEKVVAENQNKHRINPIILLFPMVEEGKKKKEGRTDQKLSGY